MPNHRHSQNGVALITALLILVLAVTAAAFLTNQHQLSIRRTGNVINGNQAYLYALGAESFTMGILYEDRRDNEVDSFEDDWARETLPLPIDGGFVKGKISDLQGKFNINNLLKDGKIDPVSVARFERLLEQFQIEPTFAQAVIDWLDDNFDPSGPNGAEDDYYIGLETPYRTANGPISTISELKLIKGINEDDEKLNLLLEHITALPEHTSINVNTASMPVLTALGLGESVAESVARRPRAPLGAEDENIDASETTAYESIEDFFRAANVARTEEFQRTDLSVSSNFFLFSGEARVDRGRSLLKSVLQRNNEGIMRVIMRTQSDF